jgi:hypothetical protein
MRDTGAVRGVAIMGVALLAGAGVVAVHGRPEWVAVIGAAGFGLVVLLGWPARGGTDATPPQRRRREPIQLVPVRDPLLPALTRHVPAARVVRPARVHRHPGQPRLEQDGQVVPRAGGSAG